MTTAINPRASSVERPHSEAELEEKVRHHYHQPKGVEQFGIELVPTEKRTVHWFDIFSIIFGFAIRPGNSPNANAWSI